MRETYNDEERAMDVSCARAPLRNPPPGWVADAKLSTPIFDRGRATLCRCMAPSSVDFGSTLIFVLVGEGWSLGGRRQSVSSCEL